MRKMIFPIYFSGIFIFSFAITLDAYFLDGKFYEEIIMPFLWIFEGFMLSCYPSCIQKSVQSETLPALTKWNLNIHLAHIVLGLSICVPIYVILTIGQHMVLLGATLLYALYFIGVVLARIIAVKSCITLLKHAEENQLCTSHFAKTHMILHAIPLLCLYSAFVLNRKFKTAQVQSQI